MTRPRSLPTTTHAVAIVALSTALAACGGSGGGTADLAPGPDLAPACGHMVRCTDQQILALDLHKAASTRTVENTADGKGFSSHVDSSAGGATPTESFVYARFTDTGLVRVDLGDQAALASTDWDIAFRRFLIRLNGGVSGPSCVTGTLAAGATYDRVTALPAGLVFDEEDYMDTACKLVPDNSGIGSPNTLLAGFWTYDQCVQMTGAVYIIRRADGRHLKLTVTSYYAPDVQSTCDTTGAVPAGSRGGDVRVRWAFLD